MLSASLGRKTPCFFRERNSVLKNQLKRFGLMKVLKVKFFFCQCESVNLSSTLWQENEQSWSIKKLNNHEQSLPLWILFNQFSLANSPDFGVAMPPCWSIPRRESNSLRDKGASEHGIQKQKRILTGGNGDPWALLNGLGLVHFFKRWMCFESWIWSLRPDPLQLCLGCQIPTSFPFTYLLGF